MMQQHKPHIEFVPVESIESEWHTPPGYPPGFSIKILASDIDEVAKTGSRSRLMRIEAGAYTTVPFHHDHWEEVYLLQGDLVVGSDERGQGGEQFTGSAYACRPPGVDHGPFASRAGCVMFELHYYRRDQRFA